MTMVRPITIVAVILQALLLCCGTKAETPQFSAVYTATGRILLPYAEIDEPFTAYFDSAKNKSRIDYYGDLELTIQRADLSEFYKLAYMVNNAGDPTRVCFNMAGTALAPVTIQSALPDLSQFTLKTSGPCRRLIPEKKFSSSNTQVKLDGACEQWEHRETIEQKENKYIFVLQRDDSRNAIPLYYLMMGYDSLLGSHYDKYELVYESYRTDAINASIFDIYTPYKCSGFPGPGDMVRHSAHLNPMHEFVARDSTHIDDHFGRFVAEHAKSYDSSTNEHIERAHHFRHNYRFIASHNRRSHTYKVAVNGFADRSAHEMRSLRGVLPLGGSNLGRSNGGLPFDTNKYDRSKLPEQWDWRLAGAVTPVKDQAICGSCWSFGVTGTIEGVYFVKTGKLISLSQQQLIDCSWSEANNGCDGGQDFRSYKYIESAGGIAASEDYGSYLGADGKCHDKATRKAVKIAGFYNVTTNDPEAMKMAIYYHGPVTVAIDASPRSFSFYSHGVYYDPKCKSGLDDLDHQVLAVGYGELRGQKYWLIKNSWSTYWGNDGYVLINQKQNDCGVLTQPSFPLIK